MIASLFGMTRSPSGQSDGHQSGGDSESGTAVTSSVSTSGVSQLSKMKWGGMKGRELIHEKAHECVYDQNCTPLFKNIEQEAWGAVTGFLKTGYWSGAFFADSIAPAVQASTWVNRFDPNQPEKLKWSRLPLQ
jgi:hypothetical protein